MKTPKVYNPMSASIDFVNKQNRQQAQKVLEIAKNQNKTAKFIKKGVSFEKLNINH